MSNSDFYGFPFIPVMERVGGGKVDAFAVVCACVLINREAPLTLSQPCEGLLARSQPWKCVYTQSTVKVCQQPVSG